ncbi:MATE family efflux transporter [Clostridiaceae bacterium HSG29]|nr:MATE family efflux transporter [Clostridiaceae bacterium HSG29]
MKNELDLRIDDTKKIFLKFAIPSIFIMILQSTAGFIDSMFIGKYVGANGLAAVTLVSPIIMLLAGIGTMVAIGGTTLSGIFKGKADIEKSNNFFNVTMMLLTIISILATIFVLFFGKSFGPWMGAKGEVVLYVKDYSTTLSLFFVPFLLNFVMGFFLKLDGKPLAAVIPIALGTILNIVLNYIFIIYMNLGIRGAAFATGLAQLIPFFMLLYELIFKSNWKFMKPIFYKNEIIQMLFNGSSELLSMASVSISAFVYNMIIINKIGLNGVAAYAVAVQIGNLSIGMFYGLAESVQSAISVNYGARQFKRVRELKNLTLKSNFIAGLSIFLIVLIFKENIAMIFISDKSTIELSMFIMNFFGFAYIFSGINISFATYYTSLNSPIISGGITVYRSLISLIVGLLLLPLIFGINGIWGATIFSEITSVIVAYLCYKKWPYGLKEKNKIINETKIICEKTN